MGRRVELTPALKASITSLIGSPPANWDGIACFELINVTTRPVNQTGLWNGSVLEKSVLDEAAAWLNAGGMVPFIMNHDTWRGDIKGRLFNAAVTQSPDGAYELRSMVYLNAGSDPKLVDDLDNAIRDQVSIGLKAKQLLCSGCLAAGKIFDYQTNLDALYYDNCCSEGHALGYGTFHMVMRGFSNWFETSSVMQGASDGARVVPKDRQTLTRLVASSHNVATTNLRGVLCASVEQPKMEPEKPEDVVTALKLELTAEKVKVEDLTSKLATATNELNQLKASVTSDPTLQASLTTANERVTTLQASLTTAQSQVTTLQASLTTANEKVNTLQASLTEREGELAQVKIKLTEAETKLSALSQEYLDIQAKARDYQGYVEFAKPVVSAEKLSFFTGISAKDGEATIPSDVAALYQ